MEINILFKECRCNKLFLHSKSHMRYAADYSAVLFYFILSWWHEDMSVEMVLQVCRWPGSQNLKNIHDTHNTSTAMSVNIVHLKRFSMKTNVHWNMKCR